MTPNLTVMTNFLPPICNYVVTHSLSQNYSKNKKIFYKTVYLTVGLSYCPTLQFFVLSKKDKQLKLNSSKINLIYSARQCPSLLVVPLSNVDCFTFHMECHRKAVERNQFFCHIQHVTNNKT